MQEQPVEDIMRALAGYVKRYHEIPKELREQAIQQDRIVRSQRDQQKVSFR